MIEKEYKFFVDKDKFGEVAEHAGQNLKQKKDVIQTNHYFDTPELSLHKQNITLRVRQIDDKYVFQKKTHGAASGSLLTSAEEERPINELPDRLKLDGHTYALQGGMTTHRKSYVLSNVSQLDLDENLYSGVVDYEIEIETDDPDDTALLDFISRFRLDDYPPNKNKAARFFEKP